MKHDWKLSKFVKHCGTLGLIGLILCVSLNAYAATKMELMVSAAISLKDVVTRLAADFEKTHQDCKVTLNFASSGQLMAQIETGAPVDVFFSAGTKEVDTLAAKDLIVVDTRINLVANQIVLIKNKTQELTLTRIDELTNPEFKRIAMGNPDSVPAGRYAKEALTFYKLYDAIQPKLVFGENVRQVLDYVARGEVEAGFVYSTDAKIEAQVDVVLEIPAEAHKAIIYPATIIKSSQQAELGKAFLLFLQSQESQTVFKKYGFIEASKN